MISFKTADNFLARFNYDLTTIQVFPPIINGKAVWARKGGEIIATGEPGSTAIAFQGKLSEQEFKKDLVLLQKQRMGVYFMVNEGDGELHNHKIVRNSDSVHTLKALFVDTDEGSPKALNAFCKDKKLRPHAIVESSPGKYHYYFLIEDTQANEENTYLWQSCQHRLASVHPSFDDSMADLGQVLRIPGFYHTKKEPFLIKIKYESDHPRYSLESVYRSIDAESTPPRKGSRFNRPERVVSAGQRHEVLTSYLASLSNQTRDSEALIDAGIGFATRHFTNPGEWLPSGSRYAELVDQVNYVVSEREKEDTLNSLRVVENVTTEQNFKKLPDEFYLKAPGVVGRMVREICHYSAQPYPSFAFAASAALVGTLKASFVRGEYRNTPPSSYFLCLTDSGRGKDFPREVVGNSFMKLGFSRLLTQKFRSAQGFLKRLSEANGIHLVLHDEAHHLFAQIRSSDADYITSLKPHLLSLFSSANTPVYDVGAVVTQNISIPPIAYPTVNYCGFGVPTGFEDTFQSAELSEGLLTRFLVLRDFQPVKPLSRSTVKIPKKFKFEAHLKELAMKLRTQMETAVLSGKSQNTKTFVQVPIDSDAFDTLLAYSERIAHSRNTSTSKILDVLQSRLVEHVNRLSVILSDDRITKAVIDWCITFVDHCYENVAVHAESFSKGQGNKDLDDLLQFVAERQRISKGPMQAQDFCFFRIRDRHALQNTIQLAIDLNKIQKHDRYRKPGQTKGRTSTAYSVLE